MFCRTFSTSIFGWFLGGVFFRIFPDFRRFLELKWSGVTLALAPFSGLFPDMDFWMHFDRPLAHSWHPLGSTCHHFSSLWLPCASLELPSATLWFVLVTFFVNFSQTFLDFLAFRLILGWKSCFFLGTRVRESPADGRLRPDRMRITACTPPFPRARSGTLPQAT